MIWQWVLTAKEVTLIGEALDSGYISDLMSKVEILIVKTITWQVISSDAEIDAETALMVWQID